MAALRKHARLAASKEWMCIKNANARRIFRFAIVIICGLGIDIHVSGTGHLTQLLWFFTVVSNLIVFFYFLYILLQDFSQGNGYHESAPVKGAVTMCIMLTGLVFNIVLRKEMGASASQMPGNFFVHILTPTLVFIDYLLFTPKGRFEFVDPWIWALIPGIYIAAIYIRALNGGAPFTVGADSSLYPYPFMDIDKNGTVPTITLLAEMTGAYIILGYLYVALDRILEAVAAHRHRNDPSTPSDPNPNAEVIASSTQTDAVAQTLGTEADSTGSDAAKTLTAGSSRTDSTSA